jgi:hypothetical protein
MTLVCHLGIIRLHTCFWFWFCSTGVWTQGLYCWSHIQPFFALVIYQRGSCTFAWASLVLWSYDPHLPRSQNYRHAASYLAYVLRKGLANFLHRLASNQDLPIFLHTLSGWVVLGFLWWSVCSRGWPGTCYVAQAGLKLVISLPQSPKCRNYRCVLPHAATIPIINTKEKVYPCPVISSKWEEEWHSFLASECHTLPYQFSRVGPPGADIGRNQNGSNSLGMI